MGFCNRRLRGPKGRGSESIKLSFSLNEPIVAPESKHIPIMPTGKTSQQAQWGKNIENRPKTSRFKGVNSRHGKWRAQIQVNDKSYHLGYFTDEISAAKAYDNAAKNAFGPYSMTNEMIYGKYWGG